MSATLGYHLTKTTYGTWLPGDARGSWSEAWLSQRGYFGAHQLHEGDPVRHDMARGRMRYAPTVLNAEMIAVVVSTLTNCVERSRGGLTIIAAAIEPTHMHLLLAETGRNIDNTAKWIADQTTKAIHRQTRHQGPDWTKNNWCDHSDDQEHWENAILYIDDHNVRAGRGPRPYPFLADVEI